MTHRLEVRLPQRSCTPLDRNRALATAEMSVERTGLKPVFLERRAMRGCEQSMERGGIQKIHQGSSSPRVEFNFSKLYYPWCFGEA